jgi:hypothetical protein
MRVGNDFGKAGKQRRAGYTGFTVTHCAFYQGTSVVTQQHRRNGSHSNHSSNTEKKESGDQADSVLSVCQQRQPHGQVLSAKLRACKTDLSGSRFAAIKADDQLRM